MNWFLLSSLEERAWQTNALCTVIFSGVVAAKVGIVGKDAKLALAKISFNVLLPCNGFIKIATGVTAGGLKIFWYGHVLQLFLILQSKDLIKPSNIVFNQPAIPQTGN